MADKVDYFIERTDKRLESLEGKIDMLLAFKWQIIGGSAAVSAIVGIVVSLIGGN